MDVALPRRNDSTFAVQKKQPGHPVRPRDAASLVILRGQGQDAEVLMGRREPRHRFMPNFFVFPGGRVDTTDAQASVSRPLDHQVAARLRQQWSKDLAHALGVAAVRETFEETGLAFGKVRDDGRLLPDLSRLHYVARAITPTDSPIRYHARFFYADAAAASGDLRGNGELLDLQWIKLPTALAMPIADVTEFVLEEVCRLQRRGTQPGIPLFSYRNGRPAILYE